MAVDVFDLIERRTNWSELIGGLLAGSVTRYFPSFCQPFPPGPPLTLTNSALQLESFGGKHVDVVVADRAGIDGRIVTILHGKRHRQSGLIHMVNARDRRRRVRDDGVER